MVIGKTLKYINPSIDGPVRPRRWNIEKISTIDYNGYRFYIPRNINFRIMQYLRYHIY